MPEPYPTVSYVEDNSFIYKELFVTNKSYKRLQSLNEAANFAMEDNRRPLRYWTSKEDEFLLATVHRLSGSVSRSANPDWHDVAMTMNKEAAAHGFIPRPYNVINTRLRYRKKVETTSELSASNFAIHPQSENVATGAAGAQVFAPTKPVKYEDVRSAGQSSLAQIWEQLKADLETNDYGSTRQISLVHVWEQVEADLEAKDIEDSASKTLAGGT